jgi:AcrR family transcriptional regulator
MRNACKVIDAAFEVFAERGIDATVPEIAERAGVGKATVYRSFPTKAHLLEAVRARGELWFARELQATLEEPDGWLAFEGLIERMFANTRRDRVFTETVRAGKDVPRSATADQRNDLLLGVLRRAKEPSASNAHRMAADATVADLRLLFQGMSRTLIMSEDYSEAAWRRAAHLLIAALRSA